MDVDLLKESLKKRYNEIFRQYADTFFVVPCAIELFGNYCAREGGKALGMTGDMAVYALGRERNDKIVRIIQATYHQIHIDISNLNGRREEFFQPEGLVRGILAKFVINNRKVGGLNLVVDTDYWGGVNAGSLTAFGLMVASAINHFYNDDQISKGELTSVVLYAMDKYYGKKGSLFKANCIQNGGFAEYDFSSPKAVVARPCPSIKSTYRIYLINTHVPTAPYSPFYEAIYKDMDSVAEYFGKKRLIEVDEQRFLQFVTVPQSYVSIMAKLRSQFFYDENKRTGSAKERLDNNDIEGFLKLMNDSSLAANYYLQNFSLDQNPNGPIYKALSIGKTCIKNGAIKVQGLGYAGTLVAIVQQRDCPNFVYQINHAFGKDSIREMKTIYNGIEISKI